MTLDVRRRETIAHLNARENVGLHIVVAAVSAHGMELGRRKASARGAETPRRYEGLHLSRTYDWSSPAMPDDVLIR